MPIASRMRAAALLLAMLGGCSQPPAPPVGTGAREAVQAYYEGLLHQDWRQAYFTLHPDSKKHLTQEAFSRLADAYRRSLGFDPDEVHVLTCDEEGTKALAHVVLTGRDASKQRRYKDAVLLHQTVDGWGIMLPPSFGRATR